MKLLFSVVIAASYGLSMRLLFGLFDGALGVMTISFFFLVPFLIGYLTIILLPYKDSHTSAGAFFKPWLTCLLILIITIFLNIEGAVCWVMAYPFFSVVAGLGGCLAFNRKKRRAISKIDWDFDKEDWEKPGSLKISLLFLVPVLAGLIEGDRISAEEQRSVTKEITVRSPPSAVWNTLLKNTSRPAPKKHPASLSTFFGFPHHISTTLDTAAVGGSRIAAYEKGLVFTETITRLIPGQSLTLSIKNDPSAISRAIMDEHIVIGGKHVQLQEDEYSLKAMPDGTTRLCLTSHFSINTPFNWYAGFWAGWLMSDILSEELKDHEPWNASMD